MSVKVCVLAAALAVLARTHVALLPGWVVPLPVLLVAAELTAAIVFVAWLSCQVRRESRRPPWAPASAGGGQP